ncbi:MAG: hypothetical protein JOZ98_05760 [Solirubrobacterales bacterium]|nr:hypothetical protein [Solirubrobacterales bacterium]
MKKAIATGTVLVAALGAAWAYMVSDDKRFEKLEKGADAILDRLTSS